MEQLIEEKVAEAKAKLNEILEEIKGMAENVIAEVKQKLDEVKNKLQQQIDDLKNQFGDKIAACIDAQEEQINQLESLEGLKSCVTDKVDAAIAIVNKIIADVESVRTIVDNLKEQLATCNNDLLCCGKVAAAAAKQLVAIPTDIAKQIAEATKLITTLKTDLEQCALNQVTQMGLQAAQILKEITECAMSQN